MRRLFISGLVLLVSAAAVGLGFWQLGRLAERRERNRLALAQRALPILVWKPGSRAGLEPDRRATLEGTLDETREFLLRGRSVQGAPAVQVITPLRLAGSDTAVLVNRGYVPAPDAVHPGAVQWSESERSRFQGVLLRVPDRQDGEPIARGAQETWRALDLRAMRERLPYPLATVYLIAEPDSGTAAHTIQGKVYPFRAEPPPLSDGPHLSYAIQWFGIAAAVLAFGVLFVWRRRPADRLASRDGPA